MSKPRFAQVYRSVLRTFCLIAALAVIHIGTVAQAQELSSEQVAALHAKVAEFNQAMMNGDFETVTGVTPPKMIAHIASSAGLDEAALRQGMIQQIKSAMELVKLEGFSMDLEATKYKALPDGSVFALIPTETKMDLGEAGRIQQNSDTLALMDEGQWYLVRIADVAQASILKQVYPQFDGVAFSQGTMKTLQ